jgi:hypothetical protein
MRSSRAGRAVRWSKVLTLPTNVRSYSMKIARQFAIYFPR